MIRAKIEIFDDTKVLIALTADNKGVAVTAEGSWVTFRENGKMGKLSIPLSNWERVMGFGQWTLDQLREKLYELGA